MHIRSVIVFCLFFFSVQLIHGQTYEQLKDSLEAATKMSDRYPDDDNMRLKKASWNIMLEQWAYAQREYDIVLSRNPSNVAALYFRAFTNEKLKRYKYARKDYETMLKIVPGNFNGTLGLALLNQNDMHYTEAMDLINQLIEQYPDSAVAYAARAGMEQERGMLELAEYDYGEAIRLCPDNTDYIINRVDVRLKLGRRKEARDDLELAVSKGVPRPSLADLYAKCEKKGRK